ncbi:MAG: hypothetical protein M5T61_06130 [Acidimicrobiia bacterium]|nr:hypothetical protein [Acidimicrobiia bacterium]
MRIASIHPRAGDDEIAAIGAALAVLAEEDRRAADAAARIESSEQLSAWVDASRRSAQRSGLQRGPWRLSGRIGRRSRV